MARRRSWPGTAGLVVVSTLALLAAHQQPAVRVDVRPVASSSAYATAVAADNPVSYWRLGEATGTALAATGSAAHPGALASGSTLRASGALSGDPDTAVAGGFTASAVGLPSGAAARTVELWFRGNQQDASVTYGQADSGDAFSVVASPNAGSVTVSDGQDLGSDVFGTPYSINDGAWHLLDASLAAGTVTVYLDGQPIGAQPLGGLTTVTTGQSLVANDPQGLDEVAVYPTAVNAAHLSTRWAQGAAARAACPAVSSSRYPLVALGDTPVAYYRLGEPSADVSARVAFDSSGRCADATFGTNSAPVAGALSGDADTAITGSFTASAAGLPAGAAARTVEAWFKASSSATTLSYGDTADSDGFTVVADPNGNAITVSDGQPLGADRFAAPKPFNDGGWHLLDVAFDGSTVTPYLDGQPIGSKPLNGLTTTVAGQPLQASGPQGLDEVAVYPNAITADDIGLHYLRGSDSATAVVRGVVTTGNQVVPGALVQLCATGGGACTQIQTDAQGGYRFPVTYGSFGISVYPPVSGTGSDTVLTTAVAATSPQAPYAQVDVALQAPSLAPGSSLTSPTSGTVTSGQPKIFWQEATVYRTTGCKNGFGYVLVSAPDTTTGQSSSRFVRLTESPVGSGSYSAIIPPLAPLHGLGRFVPEVYCAPRLSFFPQAGPDAGGTPVFVHVNSATVTSAKFGSVVGTAFTKISNDLYRVTAPAGTGDVPLTLGYADGTTTTLGSFHYLAASLNGTTSGPADGGGLIDIRGHGFTAGAQVVIGGRASPSVQVVSPTQLLVVAPPSAGSNSVTVISQGGSISAGTYTAGGTPDARTLIKFQEEYIDRTLLLMAILLPEAGLPGIALEISSFFLGNLLGESLPEDEGLLLSAISIMASVIVGPEAILVTVAMYVVLLINPFGFFDVLIDPSGTVVDSRGVPVSGVTVTLSRQDGGTLTPVPDGSQTIDPSTNPLVTGGAGTFAWEATAGIYQVSATSPQCLDAQGRAVTVTTALFGIPPPVTGIVLKLPCVIGAAVLPAVTAVSPSVVTAPGGDTVTVSGTGFDGVTQVQVGTKAATSWKALSPTSLQVVVPSGTAGAAASDIRVVTPTGTSAVVAGDQVTYVTPPTSVTNPGVGRGAVNQPITITGSHLTGTTKITTATAGVTFTNVKVVNDTKVTATVSVTATAAIGPVSFTLAPASGAGTPCASCLAITPPPTLTGAARTISVTRGGGAVTVQLALLLQAGGRILVNGQTGITAGVLENSGTAVVVTISATTAVPAGTYHLTFINPDGGRVTPTSLSIAVQ